jgi:probable rRNA maturation factor
MVIDVEEVRRAVQMVLAGEGLRSARISVALVDDATIQALNRSFLAHDYATDVLSFVLSEKDEPLEGEVVVSADMAVARAPEFGWSAANELLLYVVHGTLHLCGYEDHDQQRRRRMRERERDFLMRLGAIPGGNQRWARGSEP